MFCKINADISKIKMRALALKGIFSETTFGVLDQMLGGRGIILLIDHGLHNQVYLTNYFMN